MALQTISSGSNSGGIGRNRVTPIGRMSTEKLRKNTEIIRSAPWKVKHYREIAGNIKQGIEKARELFKQGKHSEAEKVHNEKIQKAIKAKHFSITDKFISDVIVEQSGYNSSRIKLKKDLHNLGLKKTEHANIIIGIAENDAKKIYTPEELHKFNRVNERSRNDRIKSGQEVARELDKSYKGQISVMSSHGATGVTESQLQQQATGLSSAPTGVAEVGTTIMPTAEKPIEDSTSPKSPIAPFSL
ncbi:MAG: hypothetical protein WCK11_01565 [Candidatus Falkowbacteria bacterium]